VGKNDRVKGLILDGGGDTVFNQSGRRPFWFLFAWQMKWKSFEAFAISPESVTGNPFLGSTGLYRTATRRAERVARTVPIVTGVLKVAASIFRSASRRAARAGRPCYPFSGGALSPAG